MNIQFEYCLPGPLRAFYESRFERLGTRLTVRTLAFWMLTALLIAAVAVSVLAVEAVIAPLVAAITLASVLVLILGLPLLYVRRSFGQRSSAIGRALPDALDLISVATQAGLVVDRAVQAVATRIAAPLGPEMLRTTQAIDLGQPREAAWEEFADRLDVPEVARFVYSLTEAQHYGSDLGPQLRSQAKQLREMYRNRVKLSVARATISMVVPTILFVLPAIWLTILAPAVYKVIHSGL